jgi:hypothetical protein
LQHWHPPHTGKQGDIKAVWTIHRDGTVSDVEVSPGGVSKDDKEAVLNAVKQAAPFPPLPKEAGSQVDVEFCFEVTKPTPLGLTVGQAASKFGDAARKQMLPSFQKLQMSYPPSDVTMIGLKDEKQLLVFARGKNGEVKQLHSYPLVSLSGVLGPKLKRGDLQVPEGIYNVIGLRASYHLALDIGYPNKKDRANAAADKRADLGSDIQIHGGSVSTGCLVVSEDDIKEIFVLAHDCGIGRLKVIIAPCNLAARSAGIDMKKQPKWLPVLYAQLKQELAKYPVVVEQSRPLTGCASQPHPVN